MKYKKIIISTIIILNIAIVIYVRLGNNGFRNLPQDRGSSFIMNTMVQMRVYGDNASEIIEESFERIRDIENKMSVNIEDSYIYQINANAGKPPVTVDDETFMVIKKAIEYAELSAGKFDPSIGPLVKLWGIGTANARVPAEEEINRAMGKVNYQWIELDEDTNSVMLRKEGMSIDLGAIAKGYAADVVKNIVEDKHSESAYIDIGGNIFVIGDKPDGKPWNIGIQDPRKNRGNLMAAIHLSDQTIVTSGNYERYFVEDELIYHHIIDPDTGRPARSGMMSTSIITDNSLSADAFSTIVFMQSPEKSMELIEKNEGVEAMIIKEDLGIILSTGLKDKIKILNVDFYIIE